MRVSGKFIFNLVQEGVDGHGREQLSGLLDRGQPDAREPAVPDIVKAKQGKVVRDPDAFFFRCLQNAQRIGVGRGKDGGVLQGL